MFGHLRGRRTDEIDIDDIVHVRMIGMAAVLHRPKILVRVDDLFREQESVVRPRPEAPRRPSFHEVQDDRRRAARDDVHRRQSAEAHRAPLGHQLVREEDAEELHVWGGFSTRPPDGLENPSHIPCRISSAA